jgi:hypothetical protein
MKRLSIIALLALICICLLSSCSNKRESGILEGTVFLVLKGGESLKLGLVSVMIFDENLFRSNVNAMAEDPNVTNDFSRLEERVRYAEGQVTALMRSSESM